MSFYKWLLTSMLIAILALAAACDDDDDDTGGDTGGDTSPSGAAVCNEQQAVQAAATDLSNIDVSAEGTNALESQLATLSSDLEDLGAAVSEDVQDEVGALETAVAGAEDILAGISDDATLNERIDDVQAAVTGVVTASQDLGTALESECP